MICDYCDEPSTDLRPRAVGKLCPECDKCSYCGKPADGADGRRRACDDCAQDLCAAAERERRERAYEAWVDAEIDRRKEEGWRR
jgi:hypothetical protein